VTSMRGTSDQSTKSQDENIDLHRRPFQRLERKGRQLPLLLHRNMRSTVTPAIILALLCSACGSLPKIPSTLAERSTSYSYIPLDPLAVITIPGTSCTNQDSKYKELLDSLPDQSVRLAVGKFDASGALVYGPVQATVSTGVYQVVLDYISVDTSNVAVYVERFTLPKIDSKGRTIPARPLSVFDDTYQELTTYTIRGSMISKIADHLPSAKPSGSNPSSAGEIVVPGEEVVVPVYVGIGLRLTASVLVLKAGAKLSSLGAIAAEAEAGRLTGSLVVQTLGVSGKSVSTALPLPSELTQTTVQNAILSLGSIKATLYVSDTTQIAPRVVGIYNPIGGGQQVVNGIISVLARSPIEWRRPCSNPTNAPIVR
jgi:hypothetical protein